MTLIIRQQTHCISYALVLYNFDIFQLMIYQSTTILCCKNGLYTVPYTQKQHFILGPLKFFALLS